MTGISLSPRIWKPLNCKKRARTKVRAHFRLSNKPRRVRCVSSEKGSKSFSTAACTWAKTLLRLQVWNLFAYGEQIMRAADCKNLAEKPEGVFRQAQASPDERPGSVVISKGRRGRGLPWSCRPGPAPPRACPPRRSHHATCPGNRASARWLSPPSTGR